MKKLKKILSVLLSLLILLNFSVTAMEIESNNIFTDYTEIIKSDVKQNSVPVLTSRTSNEKVIIHNNGKMIASDYFVEGQNQGNYLIAITYITEGSNIIETAHFADVETVSKENFINMINAHESNIRTAKLESVISLQSTIKRYNWSFYDPTTNVLLATLTTAVTLDRKTNNATIDGIPCSVWDVTSFTQLEKREATRLNDQYTRLSVDLANQELIAYGPSESTSGGDITVGLDGAGVPSFSYTFNIDGFSVEDLSSMWNNYGRWAFVDNFGSEPHFTTKPGIRATNTNGDFIVELSHTVNMNTWASGLVDKGTGVLRIYVLDR